MTSSEIWTIKAALDWTVGYLERKGDENPRLSAEWLLSEATGKPRIELYMNFDQPLSMDERDVLRAYVTRRGKGEPLQYITGEVAFRHIMVKVRPGVLIPRPETEVLVSEVLALLPQAPRPRTRESLAGDAAYAGEACSEGLAVVGESEPAGESGRPLAGEGEGELAGAAEGATERDRTVLVADLCTGSGCIACSLAYEHPQVRVVATDIADEAIALASENVAALGLGDRVEVLQCSLGEGVDATHLGNFDAVVSNPPYIPSAVLDEIPREVTHFEPSLALDGGEDGLDLFRPLCAWAQRALKPGGVLACELHEGHMDEAAGVAGEAGFVDVRIVNDLAGRPRVITACKAS